MLFSKACNYAIRAALYISSRREQGIVPIREISDELDISFHFLTKILQQLTRHNILSSLKGPRGGVALNMAAKDISLKSIVLAIDGDEFFKGCILRLDQCDDAHPCPIHDEWQPVRRQLLNFLESTTLDQFESKVKSNKFRMISGYSKESNIMINTK